MQPTHHPIEIITFSPELADAFEQINREWISTMFEIEASEQAILQDPKTHIIDTGGYVYFAKHPELGVIGTCALKKESEGIYELTKMGVLEKARGLHAGDLLMRHVLADVPALPIDELFLLTNKKCQTAIHLYLKHGFAHDPDIMNKYGAHYIRCDVAMRYLGTVRQTHT